jgi:hypothetical protein
MNRLFARLLLAVVVVVVGIAGCTVGPITKPERPMPRGGRPEHATGDAGERHRR